MQCVSVTEAVDLLRHCLEQGRVVLGKHFTEELKADGLALAEAYHVLRTGAVFDLPDKDIKTGDWKYRVEGKEPDGKWLVIVFCFKEVDTTFLITIWSMEQARR